MSTKGELFSGLVLLVVTLIFWTEIQLIEDDPSSIGIHPATFPEAVGLMLGAMTLIMVGNAARKIRREDFKIADTKELRLFFVWVLPMAAITVIYILLIDLIQYLVPTALALSATLALFGNRKFKWHLTIPAISSVVYYVLFFGIFRLDEPRGRWIEFDNYYLFGAIRHFLGI